MKQKVVYLCKEIEVNDVETNHIIPFKKITTLHFGRFLVLDENTDALGNPVSARLVFTTNYDLPFDNHLNQLISVEARDRAVSSARNQFFGALSLQQGNTVRYTNRIFCPLADCK